MEELKNLINMFNSILDQLIELQEIQRKINEAISFESEFDDNGYEIVKALVIDKNKIEKLVKIHMTFSEDYEYLEDKIKEMPVIWR
jgi:hypothetical protein